MSTKIERQRWGASWNGERGWHDYGHDREKRGDSSSVVGAEKGSGGGTRLAHVFVSKRGKGW